MTPLRALALGGVAYGAFLVATVPAQVVARQAERISSGQARLAGAAGTAWNGSARLELEARGVPLAIDELRWRFLPSRLLAGRAAFLVEARSGGLEATAELSRGLLAWQARDLAARADAAILANFFPLTAAWQPAGALVVEAERLEWDGRNAEGGAALEWREASLALSSVRPLGSWRAKATAQGDGAKLGLETLEGPLRLSGEGTLSRAGRLAFSGEARAQAGHERDLGPLLDLVGPARADGARAIELR